MTNSVSTSIQNKYLYDLWNSNKNDTTAEEGVSRNEILKNGGTQYLNEDAFSAADTDGNGVLNADEFDNYIAMLNGSITIPSTSTDSTNGSDSTSTDTDSTTGSTGSTSSGTNATGTSVQLDADVIAALDANGDGVVTLDELYSYIQSVTRKDDTGDTTPPVDDDDTGNTTPPVDDDDTGNTTPSPSVNTPTTPSSAMINPTNGELTAVIARGLTEGEDLTTTVGSWLQKVQDNYTTRLLSDFAGLDYVLLDDVLSEMKEFVKSYTGSAAYFDMAMETKYTEIVNKAKANSPNKKVSDLYEQIFTNNRSLYTDASGNENLTVKQKIFDALEEVRTNALKNSAPYGDDFITELTTAMTDKVAELKTDMESETVINSVYNSNVAATGSTSNPNILDLDIDDIRSALGVSSSTTLDKIGEIIKENLTALKDEYINNLADGVSFDSSALQTILTKYAMDLKIQIENQDKIETIKKNVVQYGVNIFKSFGFTDAQLSQSGSIYQAIEELVDEAYQSFINDPSNDLSNANFTNNLQKYLIQYITEAKDNTKITSAATDYNNAVNNYGVIIDTHAEFPQYKEDVKTLLMEMIAKGVEVMLKGNILTDEDSIDAILTTYTSPAALQIDIDNLLNVVNARDTKLKELAKANGATLSDMAAYNLNLLTSVPDYKEMLNIADKSNSYKPTNMGAVVIGRQFLGKEIRDANGDLVYTVNSRSTLCDVLYMKAKTETIFTNKSIYGITELYKDELMFALKDVAAEIFDKYNISISDSEIKTIVGNVIQYFKDNDSVTYADSSEFISALFEKLNERLYAELEKLIATRLN